MCGCLSHARTRNLGMCPDWESNHRPFGSQSSAQPTEPHQPGRYLFFKVVTYHLLTYSLPYITYLFIMFIVHCLFVPPRI